MEEEAFGNVAAQYLLDCACLQKHPVTSNKTLLSLIYERYISFSVQKQRVQKILLHEEGIVFYSWKLQAS